MATYPVWIGNLKETVKEKDLMRVFGKNKYEGGIASCKVMRDENGQSKKFGYVNFHLEADAESAAVKMSGFKIESVPIKTKGPSALRELGHLTQNLDYRPFTDCLFYVQTGNCKKGEQVCETTYVYVCKNKPTSTGYIWPTCAVCAQACCLFSNFMY